MIYFVLVASVLAVQNGAVLEMTGDAAKIEFGGALTLIHNTTENELVCSGKIKATDVLIEGTSTTVAQMMTRLATLEQEMAAVKLFVGMMPPASPSPPLPPSPPSPPPPRRPRHLRSRHRHHVLPNLMLVSITTIAIYNLHPTMPRPSRVRSIAKLLLHFFHG